MSDLTIAYNLEVTEEWQGDLADIRKQGMAQFNSVESAPEESSKAKGMRLAIAATHCVEWIEVRLLLQEAIRIGLQANSRGDLLIAGDKARFAKIIIEAMSRMQEQERVAYRLDRTAIPHTNSELEKIGKIIFTIQKEMATPGGIDYDEDAEYPGQ